MSSLASIAENLTCAQKQAVFHKDGPLLVIAGPGSGKTRVITHRIAALVKQGVLPSNICAVTFTNKAADEMRQRVLAMDVPQGVHLSTFHSLCVRILRKFNEAAAIAPAFSIYDESEQKKCVKEAVKAAQLDSKNFPPAAMLETISRLKNNLQDVAAFEDSNGGDYFSQCVLKIYRGYQKILEKNNALDFDDLLLKTAFLLRNFPDIRKQLNDRFKYLMIDEYQDTNHAQYQIAKGLASEHNNICVTGDPDQSIYGWRGADIGNILAFEHDWPDATVIKLEENFRSMPEILTVADRLIVANKSRKQKKLLPVKAAGGEITVRCLEDEQAEAEFIAQYTKQILDSGTDANKIAIFYRVNSMSRAIEEAFVVNRIPYQIIRGVEFYNRKEIRDILAYLKLIVNPYDDLALERVINTPARGIGQTTISRLAEYAAVKNTSIYQVVKDCSEINLISAGVKIKLKAFADMIENFKNDLAQPAAVFIENVFKASGLYESLKAEAAEEAYSKAPPIDNVSELINSARRFDQQQGGNLVDFLQHIALFSDTDTYDAKSGKVSLMTLHCAKGLEFENVVIAGLEQGLLPHERSSDNPADLEEERRLFFVGITRAKKRLAVTLCRYRTIHGQFTRTIMSQFLFDAALEPQEIIEQESDLDYDESDRQDSYQEPAPKAADVNVAGNDFAIGRLVSHKKFGTGRIKELHNLGADSIVVVEFKSGTVKPLMLKYANLTIIGQKQKH
jgi:DNA helicase-2/ATP-dependent DNA helicase PcrA